MTEKSITQMADALLLLAAESQWEVRHASLMGIQHLLAARTVRKRDRNNYYPSNAQPLSCNLIICPPLLLPVSLYLFPTPHAWPLLCNLISAPTCTCIFIYSPLPILPPSQDFCSFLLPSLFPSILRGLQDTDDDVRAVAAASLLPVSAELTTLLPNEARSIFCDPLIGQ